MKREMEELREKIHKLLEADPIDPKKVLLLSQKMDKLILRYYKSKMTESFVRTKLKCE